MSPFNHPSAGANKWSRRHPLVARATRREFKLGRVTSGSWHAYEGRPAPSVGEQRTRRASRLAPLSRQLHFRLARRRYLASQASNPISARTIENYKQRSNAKQTELIYDCRLCNTGKHKARIFPKCPSYGHNLAQELMQILASLETIWSTFVQLGKSELALVACQREPAGLAY